MNYDSNSAPLVPRLLAFAETIRCVASSKPSALSALTSSGELDA